MNDGREDRGDIAVAERLTKHFTSGAATVKAVDEVNVRLPRYAIVALPGPRGVGKSPLPNPVGAPDTPGAGGLGVRGCATVRAIGALAHAGVALPSSSLWGATRPAIN